MMSRKSTVGVVAVAGVLTVVSQAGSPSASAQAMGQDMGPLIGQVVRVDGLLDESGRTITLTPQGAEAGPLILAPMYARCPHTCSPLTANLLRAVKEAGQRLGSYRVASLSIDPKETAENLRAFRERLGLPSEWLLLRAGEVGRLRELLAALRFVAIERDDGQFDHPNVVYVLAADGVVTRVLPGLALTSTELVSAVEQARGGRAPWWRQYLLAVAALGLAGSAWVFWTTWLRQFQRARSHRRGTDTASART